MWLGWFKVDFSCAVVPEHQQQPLEHRIDLPSGSKSTPPQNASLMLPLCVTDAATMNLPIFTVTIAGGSTPIGVALLKFSRKSTREITSTSTKFYLSRSLVQPLII